MPAARPRPQRGPWRRGIVIALKVGLVAGLAALIALAIAVYVARSSLPSFEELKSSPNGQAIRVFADDRSEEHTSDRSEHASPRS